MGRYLLDHTQFDRTLLLDDHGQPLISPWGGNGEWGQDRLPHSGWMYLPKDDPDGDEGIYDIKMADYWHQEELIKCAMCQTQWIKRVHRLIHDKAPGEVLLVGKTCAYHMVRQGLAESMEKALTVQTAAKWRPKGNGFVFRTYGYGLAVFRAPGGWRGWHSGGGDGGTRSSRVYKTLRTAQFRTVLALVKYRGDRQEGARRLKGELT